MPTELGDHLRALILAFERQRENYAALNAVLAALEEVLGSYAVGEPGPRGGVDELIEREQEALEKIRRMEQHISFLQERAAKCLSVEELTLGALREAAAARGDQELADAAGVLDKLTGELLGEARAMEELVGRVETKLADGLRYLKSELSRIELGKRFVRAYQSMGRDAVPRFVDKEG